jgi:hypothetical protein
MGFFDFVDAHPVLTVFLVVVVGGLLVDLVRACRGG